MPDLRLLIDPAATGAWNMAVDEALFETAAVTGRPTLRFYGWSEPTLSLGYFQSIADRVQHAASRECPLVRRSSGGGAILHDRELTYSLATAQRPGSIAAARDLCHEVHQTLIAALAELGVTAIPYRTAANCRTATESSLQSQPFLCFQRRTCSDIVYCGAKIVGSAQRRQREAVLQHGSILLVRSRFAPELPGIADLAGAPIAAGELCSCWVPRLAELLGLSVNRGELSSEEKKRAENLVQSRFAATPHLERR